MHLHAGFSGHNKQDQSQEQEFKSSSRGSVKERAPTRLNASDCSSLCSSLRAILQCYQVAFKIPNDAYLI